MTLPFPLKGFRLVAVVALVFWVFCCVFALQRYFNFYPTYVAFDQGIFNQVFWNNLHGRWFESSLSSTESIYVMDGEAPDVVYRRLGQHFTPALLVWLPFYALCQSPVGLSILQVTLITAAGLVLYALARHYHPPRLSVFIAVSFYCANAVLGPTLANFHDISQIPLYLFGAFWALEKRKWGLFWSLMGLTLLVREDAGIGLFGIGIYLVLSRRQPLVGATLGVLSVGYIVFVTNVMMPMFSDDISRRFMVEQFGQFIDNREASTLEVLWAIARQPHIFLRELFSPIDRTISYLLGQWLPLAFVPVLSPATWILTAFPLTKILMQKEPDALSLHVRYALSLVPGLFYGSILWWAQHPLQFQPRIQNFWKVCIGLALVLTIASNPNRALSIVIPDSIQPWVYATPARQAEHAQAIRTLLQDIPPNASVSATSYIVAHLSNRRSVVRYPEIRIREDDRQVRQVEFLIIDLWYPQLFGAVFDDEQKTLEGMERRITEWLAQGNFGLIGFRDGVALMRSQTPSIPDSLQAWEAFRQTIPRG